MSDTLIDRYLRNGLKVIPVYPNSKIPMISDWNGSTRLSRAELDEFQPCNFGIVLGAVSGNLVDTDIDHPQAQAFADYFLPATALRHGRPSKRNSHWFYRIQDAGKTTQFQTSRLGMLIEYRASTQTVVPPSSYGDELIEFEEHGEPSVTTRELLLYAIAKVATAAVLSTHWTDGKRHLLAVPLAGYLNWIGWTESDAEAFIRSLCGVCGDPDLRDRIAAVRSTWIRQLSGQANSGSHQLGELIGLDDMNSIRSWLESNERRQTTPASPAGTITARQAAFEGTDNGRARQFADWAQAKLLYVDDAKKWLRWNGCKWEACGESGAMALASDHAKQLFDEFETSNSLTDPRRLSAVSRANSSPGIRAVVDLSKFHLAMPGSRFDTDQYAFGCANGYIDLRTGKLNAPDPSKLMTQASLVQFVPEAQCPKFRNHLEKFFPGDEEMKAYLQRVAGYFLTGDIKERAFFVAYGPTGGGKTTFFATLQRIMGDDYAKSATLNQLDAPSSEPSGHSEHLARLKGARLVEVGETKKGHPFDGTLIKRITGGELLAARNPYATSSFQFQPEFKPVIYTNHKPKLTGDKALFKRMHAIPFDVQIPEAERILGFGDILFREEAEGILAWAVEGCLQWQKHGLNPPKKVLDANAQYESESDEIQAYLDARVSCGRNAFAGKTETVADYNAWAESDGREGMKKNDLHSELKLRFSDKKKRLYKGKQMRGWTGFHLLDKAEVDSPSPPWAEEASVAGSADI